MVIPISEQKGHSCDFYQKKAHHPHVFHRQVFVETGSQARSQMRAMPRTRAGRPFKVLLGQLPGTI